MAKQGVLAHLRKAGARRPRPPRRRGVAYHERMNQVVDFINVNRDRYIDELKQYLAIPSISALPRARRRRPPLRRMDRRRVPRRRPREREADRDAGQPGGVRRLAQRARQADHPLLRPLRRAAGGPAEPVDQPAVRGHGARRRDLRARLRRRQGPGVHAHQGRRGAPEEERQPAGEHQVLHRGRRGGRQRAPRRVRALAQAGAGGRRRGDLRLADVRPRHPVDLLRPARPGVLPDRSARHEERPALGLVRRRGGQPGVRARRRSWRR